MKRNLLFLMLLLATSVSAQDVIVKKDGSTILSKVIEIGTTEIKSLLSSSTFLDYDFKIVNYTLSPSLNLLTEATNHKPHLGIGMKVNF